MAHPVLDQQRVMEGGEVAMENQAPAGSMSFTQTGGPALDKGIPNCLAAMVLGSVATLVLLRLAGFRFSFGVNVGGGS